MERQIVLRGEKMTNTPIKRCAIYTRKSTEEGLDQEFNSLHAQREACEAYIKSQRHEGWELLPDEYDDGGFSGGNMKRPALTQLMDDIENGKVDIIVVYKVDRLTRSLTDFSKLVGVMDAKGISFVSITQQFNTTTSMGRLTLNVLLSFAQFEREVTGERIRDKIALSKQKGKWMGGVVPLGYLVEERKLLIDEQGAHIITHIYKRYLALRSVNLLKAELDAENYTTPKKVSKAGNITGGKPFAKGALYKTLRNPIYAGFITHKGKRYDGEHQAIIDSEAFDAVQKLMAQNSINHSAAIGAKSPCLLAGKLFDDVGNYMTPKHSRTRKRHYRYYTSQAIIQGRHHEAGSLPNIPAGEIEKLVSDEVSTLLNDSERLQSLLINEPLDEQNRILDFTKTLRWNDSEGNRLFLQSVVSKVTISKEAIKIVLCADHLITTMRALQTNQPILSQANIDCDNPFIIVRGVTLTQSNNGSKVITGQIASGCNMQLVKAVTRSFLWHEKLLNGEVQNLLELSSETGINDKAYLRKVMRLRFLAPDIIEQILSGIQPIDWTLQKLFRVKSSDWAEQRRTLGLA